MRVVFAAGGTGGHIYPALALARHLRAAGEKEIQFIGTDRGMEKDIIPAEGFALQKIPVIGLERRLSVQMGRAVFLAGAGVMSARRLLAAFRPDVVVGTGGYVAGPVVLAAYLSRIPTVIHEQNAIPGLTNVILSRLAGRVCLSIPGSEAYFPRRARLELTGNPRASEAMLALQQENMVGLPLRPGVPVLLCVGGSHGAAKLNELFSQSVEKVLSDCDVQVVYVTGPRYFDELQQRLQNALVRFPHRLYLIPYHANLPGLLAKASLVISRAGATTLAEITALGVPALLLPSPNVTNNHQEHNARMLSDQGAAVLLPEDSLDRNRLTCILCDLLQNPVRLREMAAASRLLGFPDAAGHMAALLYDVCGK
jgi:UDP-N-acetylglucosamine--N-acetylmuramyl-(pentapeptide) pyrophosphoryl-undecaprenol N-acetylglucosamine transferase